MSLVLHRINHGSLTEGLSLLPARMNTLRARAMILKIGLQESRFMYRRQLIGNPPEPRGPAVSFYQFELNGIRGLLRHRATRQHVLALCEHFGLAPQDRAIWTAMQTVDPLGAAMARLNLYWAPDALPDIHNAEGSWDYYLNCWRPGAVKRDPVGLRDKWDDNHKKVVDYLVDHP